MPDADDLRQLNALLETGLALPPSERAAWLAALPHGALRDRLRRLLERADDADDAFLAQPALAWHADAPGDRIGPYRLLSELGRGGMASVWLAERDDAELRRQVALKLPLEGFGPGLFQRMARERDILASLEHPRIARLYEAGISDNGRPWLAMERVVGVPIDRWCRDRQLGVRQRLQLLLQVMDAVAHAHARLVVHRDLKPANIFVTPQGQVRLLDFGVAKLLHDDGGHTSPDLTRLIGRAVTPDYAAPEQLLGGPITVATDVYALGVVAFELLTGQPPYRLGEQALTDPRRAFDALRLPSASTLAGVDRGTSRALRGDLDTILAKAMKFDPAERYPSVESLAADIARHLDGLPVLARPDSLGYRGMKFVRRHRGSVSAALLVGAALVAGVVGTTWQARRAQSAAAEAQRQRDAAERELRFARGTEDFLRQVLSDGGDQAVTPHDLLVASADKIVQLTADDPPLRARLQLMVTGLAFSANHVRSAEKLGVRAVEMARDTGDAELLSHAECQLAALRSKESPDPRQVAVMSAALDRLPPAARGGEAWYGCMTTRAVAHFDLAQWDAMKADAQAVLSQAGGQGHLKTDDLITVATMLAQAHSAKGEAFEATEVARGLVDQLQRRGQLRTSGAQPTLSNLAVMLSRAGQHLQALQAAQQAVSLSAVAGRGPYPHALIAEARAWVDLQRPAEAVAALERAQAALEPAQHRQATAALSWVRAMALCAQAADAACDAARDQAHRLTEPMRPPGHSIYAFMRLLDGHVALERGDTAAARAALTAAAAQFEQATDRSAGIVSAWSTLARLDLREGASAHALQHAQQAVQASAGFSRGFAHTAFRGEALLALALAQQAAGDGAFGRTARQALDDLHATLGDEAPLTREARALAAGGG